MVVFTTSSSGMPEVGPVGALEDKPVAQCPADGVRRDKDPFRSGRKCPTEGLQLVDKGVHVRFLRRLIDPDRRKVARLSCPAPRQVSKGA